MDEAVSETEERAMVERLLEDTADLSPGRAVRKIQSAIGPGIRAPSIGTIKRWRNGSIGTPLRGNVQRAVYAYDAHLSNGDVRSGPLASPNKVGEPSEPYGDEIGTYLAPDHVRRISGLLDVKGAILILEALYERGARERWPDRSLAAIAEELARHRTDQAGSRT